MEPHGEVFAVFAAVLFISAVAGVIARSLAAAGHRACDSETDALGSSASSSLIDSSRSPVGLTMTLNRR